MQGTEIPQALKDHLTCGTVLFLGTRSKTLMPLACRVFGARPEDKTGYLTVFIQKEWAPDVLENMLDNGQISVLATLSPNFETFQFKGSYISHSDSTEEEVEYQAEYMNRFVEQAAKVRVPETSIRKFKYAPSIAVTVCIKQIFTQTPGANAGTELSGQAGGKA